MMLAFHAPPEALTMPVIIRETPAYEAGASLTLMGNRVIGRAHFLFHQLGPLALPDA